MSRTPPRAVTVAEARSTPRWAGTWSDVTNMIAAWAKLDHAANVKSRRPELVKIKPHTDFWCGIFSSPIPAWHLR